MFDTPRYGSGSHARLVSYDLMTAYHIGVTMKALAHHAHEPLIRHYQVHEILETGGLPGLVVL
jgi:hypothetical protein